MPELPEVEVIVRELRSQLVKEVFTGFEVNWAKTIIRQGLKSPLGKRIQSITRHGKFIIFHLNQDFLLIHLRMTGQLIVKQQKNNDDKHLRVVFKFKSGKRLLFYDARKFGRIYLTNNIQNVLSNIGIDALNPELTSDKFTDLLSGKKTKIKSFLLDQHFIAGLGNIYIDESLFKSSIHPTRQINQLSGQEISKLYASILTTLEGAIKNMGTTISDYKTTGGGFGTNQNYLMVYKRGELPCYVCKIPIKKIKMNGRGTHFCPRCQPIYI